MTVDRTEHEIQKLKDTAKNHGESIEELTRRFEETDKKNSEKTQKIFDTLDNIKENQHNQDLSNLELKYTMKNVNDFIEKDNETKDESRKDTKQIKYIVIGSGLTFLSSLVIAMVQIIF